jgi:hypothetical protein
MSARFDPHDSSSSSQAFGVFDWAPAIERLEREYSAAADRDRTDPWALAEAECWLDLVHAELMAAKGRNDLSTVSRLEAWAAKLSGLVERLDRLANGSKDDRLYFGLSTREQLTSSASNRDSLRATLAR